MVSLLSGVEVPFDRVTSSRVREFDAYWRSKIRGGSMPRREDIDPAEITSLLPFLVMVDIEHNPFRIRYRLCGTLVSFYDEELTGKYLEELRNTTQEEIALIAGFYRAAVFVSRPVYVAITGRSRQTGSPIAIAGGIWPLSSDGAQIDKCVAIEEFPGLT